MRLARYREVLREPAVGWLLGSSLIGRLPTGMTALAVVLAVTAGTGSYARAGLVSGTFVAGSGLAGPALGRAVDRVGRRRILLTCAAIFAVGLVGLALVVNEPLWLTLPVAFACGLAQPPLAVAVRSLWPELLEGPRLATMYALEATLQELVFIVGPALVAVLAAALGARITLGATGLLTVVGVAALVVSPAVRHRPGSSPAVRGLGAMRSKVLRRLALSGLFLIGAFAMTEVAVVAFVSGRHATAGAGVVLAVWSAGSLLGGLLFGAAGEAYRTRPVAGMLLAVAASLGVLAVAPGRFVLAVLLLAGGTTIAPAIARLNARVGEVGAGAEAFGWMTTGFLCGASAGSGLGGALVDTVGPRAVFLVAAGAVVCAAAAAA
ncbi:MAG TPA: MFS transporter, partial [Mycobacteriales bacterium]|nr:MFS transporter [Mycobacteriales bacterium]